MPAVMSVISKAPLFSSFIKFYVIYIFIKEDVTVLP